MKPKKQKVKVEGTMLTVEYPSINKKFTVDFSTYSEEIKAAALAHGFKQKYGDAKSGKSPQEKYDEVRLIHAAMLEGKWEREAEHDNTELVVAAVSRIRRVPLDKVRKAAEMEPEQVENWRASLKVKAEMAKILAERAQARAKGASDVEIIFPEDEESETESE